MKLQNSILRVIDKHLPRLAATMRRARHGTFDGSQSYWEGRYSKGGDSGAGSKGELAAYKADFLNELIATRGVELVVEWGCGDGRQLALASYPQYVGLDVSLSAIKECRERFRSDDTKRFEHISASSPIVLGEFQMAAGPAAAMSLDVIYHLVEDDVYEAYMARLFDGTADIVVVYSSDFDDPNPVRHVKHRKFTEWVSHRAPIYELDVVEKNPHPYSGDNEAGSLADFHVFVRTS